MSAPDEITKVLCLGCSQPVPPSQLDRCPHCGLALLGSQSRTTRLAMALELAGVARDLQRRLEAKGTVQGDRLAAVAATMADGFDDWRRVGMPEQTERSRQMQAVAEFQTEACRYLTGLPRKDEPDPKERKR